MLYVDAVLAVAYMLGVFLAAMYFIGYLRERVKWILVPAVTAFVSAIIPGVVLVYYATGFLEGEIQPWALLLTVPAFGMLAYSMFELFIKRAGGKGRG